MSRCLVLYLTLQLATLAPANTLVLVAGGGSEMGKEQVPATKAKLERSLRSRFRQERQHVHRRIHGAARVRVDPNGLLTVVAGTGKKGNAGDGGHATAAAFNSLHSLAIAPDGAVYLADTLNNRIRKLDAKTGLITAFAGSGARGYAGDGGPASAAQFAGIYSVAFAAPGTKLYLADLENRRIRAIDMKTGLVELVAGNGTKGVPADGADAKNAPLVDPRTVAVDRKGNVYILERSGHALHVVGPDGKIRTVAGTGKAGNELGGGDPKKAQMNGPKHLCVDLEDNVLIADSANHRVLKFWPRDGKIAVLAGTGKKGDSGKGGPALEVNMNEPHGVFVHPSGTVYIADSMNNRVFRLEK